MTEITLTNLKVALNCTRFPCQIVPSTLEINRDTLFQQSLLYLTNTLESPHRLIMFSRNTAWEAFIAFTEKTLDTGERQRGLLMRRKVDGVWQYRRPTPAEESDYVSGDAW